MSDVYQWPGHYLKFELPNGEIDFLSPPLQTEPGFGWERHRDRAIGLDTPEEVIIKKIRYRSYAFTAREAYDLAAVAGERLGLAAVIAKETADALPRVIESLRILEAKGQTYLGAQVVLTDKGRTIAANTFQIASRTVEDAVNLASTPDGGQAMNAARFLASKGRDLGD